MELKNLNLNRNLKKTVEHDGTKSSQNVSSNVDKDAATPQSFASEKQTSFNVGVILPTVYWLYYDPSTQTFSGNFPETWTIVRLGDGLALITHQLGTFNYAVLATPSFFSTPEGSGPRWKGLWNIATSYQTDDVVVYGDPALPYLALADNVGSLPDAGYPWSPMLDNAYQVFNTVSAKGRDSFLIYTTDTNGDPLDFDFSCVIFAYPL